MVYKFFFSVSALLILLLSSCDQSDAIRLSNTSEVVLSDHPIIITRDVIEREQTSQKLPVFKTKAGELVPSQFDDYDNDGEWDATTIQRNIAGNESIKLNIEWISPSDYPVFTSRTNVHLGLSQKRDDMFERVAKHTRPKDHIAMSKPYLYQYEGPGWESEVVAFRSYFDSRNGKDIFGKTQRKLHADSIGLGQNYHTLQDWGMDILKVGASLGAGALALLHKDSLYRLGETDEAHFEILSNGPVKSSFKLTYRGWQVAGVTYQLEEIITIWGGKRWYESEIKLVGGTGQDTLAVGLVNLHKLPKYERVYGDWQVMYSHGIQSENKDHLGMAILLKSDQFIAFASAPEKGDGITNTYTAYLKPDNGEYRFLFYVGWEGEDVRFADQAFLESALKNVVASSNQNIKVQKL